MDRKILVKLSFPSYREVSCILYMEKFLIKLKILLLEYKYLLIIAASVELCQVKL